MTYSAVVPRRRARVFTRLLLLVGVLAPGAVVLSTPPASAATLHHFNMTGTIDVKDDDVGTDDWCRDKPVNITDPLYHSGLNIQVLHKRVICDEVTITLDVKGELKSDERICNIVLDLKLFEGTSSFQDLPDLDGHVQWKGGMDYCLRRGGWLQWDVLRVDNGEWNSNDHGWVNNLVIRHQL